MKKLNVLIKMTGSIACYKVCNLISKLVQEGHEVQVVASGSALKFVGEATLEGLTGKKVATDTFESGRYMDHIYLNRWADLVVVAPATANFLNSAAAGLGSDLIGTLFLAHDFSKPYIVAPAMNSAMYAHPTTRASIDKLQGFGLRILETAEGTLACGEIGEGKLVDPEVIYQNIMQAQAPTKGAVLVTSGGTQEPIDSVRFITNMSTGRTGSIIADELTRAGFEVTYLHGASSALPRQKCEKVSFSSFNDLQDKLKKNLKEKNFKAVIQVAAISDFSVKNAGREKLSSDQDLKLEFVRNPKLISELREYAHNPNLKIVGFKLTSTSSAETQKNSLHKIFQAARPDLVIHNDVNEMSESEHPFHIYKTETNLTETINGPKQLASYIESWLEEQS